MPAQAQKAKRVVAHRGASGYLPEHTLAGYAMAHAQGADLIEPDVVLTRDDAPICLHDLYLETTTDVAARFPGRARADGHYYAVDFDLAEIQTLNVTGRRAAGEAPTLRGLRVPTLEELILLVRHLNRKTDRATGLLIETKDPAFHAKERHPLERPLWELLQRYDCTRPDSGVIVQSFDGDHLRRLRREFAIGLPLQYLVGELPALSALDEIAQWADGVNPSRTALEKDGTLTATGEAFLRCAREKKLRVFVWTFHAEDDALRRFLFDYGVDGVITNHPDAGVRVRGAE